MDVSYPLEALSIERLDKICLGDLDVRIGRNIDTVISRKEALDTYLAWLQENLATDMSDEQHSMIREWTACLLRHGFHKGSILQAFKQWRNIQAATDRSTLRRLLMIEQDLSDILWPENKTVQSSKSENKPSDNGFSEGRPQGTRENLIPLGERRSSKVEGKSENHNTSAPISGVSKNNDRPHKGYVCNRCGKTGKGHLHL
ncbi:hypothetical protein KJ359_005815 [Pestalotiopsis sp. 9143b]|nr:hypothetical protein KJ359_005815 [Pestalotiopsis sp. 9143b]